MPYRYSLSRSSLPAYLFVSLDLLLAVGTAELAAWVRFGSLDNGFFYHALALIQAFLLVGFSTVLLVYQPWRGRPLRRILLKTLAAWGLSFALLLAGLFALKVSESYSRLWMAFWFCGGAGLSLVLKGGIYWALRYFRRHGRNSKRVLLLGHGRNYQAIIEQFGGINDWGYRLDARLHYDQLSEVSSLLRTQLAKDDRFDELWLCLPLKDSPIIQDALHILRNHTMDIRYMPGLQDIPLLNHKVTPIGGFYSLDLSCSPMRDFNWTVKRLEDVVLASLILILVSPLMLVIALAVKLTSDGPVLFKQKRLGVNGRAIEVFKFRSMKVHKEGNHQVTQAVKGDPRLSPIGGFLRKTSLDELPQFFNVLAGSMSIVGPRPHALAHNEEYKEQVASYMKRHKIKPGITGLAQVNGLRGETDTLDKMQRRVEMDLRYINTWSVLLDLKIILLTVLKGFNDPKAY